MIVLDEQLLGRGLDTAIAAWYRGNVLFITELRPGTVIKDDTVPTLLQQQRRATFVTINASDFWQKVSLGPNFCLVCVALPDTQADSIPLLLRRLFRHPEFRTKASRMGKVARLTLTTASYYTWNDPAVRMLALSSST